MFFNGVSVAIDEDGTERKFVASHIFLNATPEEQNNLWTLNREEDFIALGFVDGDISTGGERKRKDYKLNSTTPKYGADAKIHHWEVYSL